MSSQKYSIQLYDGESILLELSSSQIKSIAALYTSIFNESAWNENWTLQKAEQEIKKSLETTSQRKIILTLLQDQKDSIVGFAWIIITSPNYLEIGDMPFCISEKKMQKSLTISKNILSIHKKIMIFKEIGIAKELRSSKNYFVADLLVPLLKKAISSNCKILFGWTSSNSSSFTRGIDLGWSPFHFISDTNIPRVFFQGNIEVTCNLLSRLKIRDRTVFNDLRQNRTEQENAFGIPNLLRRLKAGDITANEAFRDKVAVL